MRALQARFVRSIAPPVSGLAETRLLAGIAAGLALVATGADAQQAVGLRRGTPTYLAQQPVPGGTPADPGPAMPDAGGEPDTPLQTRPSSIATGAPPRASRPVQSPALRGVTQRELRPPRSDVSALPPQPEPVPPAPRRRRPAEEDPYAPLGLRLGNVVLKPALGTSVGYDSNPERSAAPGAKGSAFSRYEGELDVQSDWNVHELKGKLRGGYSQFFRNDQASRPDAEGNLDLRLDASRDTRILLETRARLDTQRPGSPDLTSAVVGRPLVYQYGGSAGVTHDFSRLQMTLRGSVDRSDYEDAQLNTGGILSQADRNQTQYGLRLRAAYEVTPGFKPFVQGEVDSRDFDEKVDSNGYRRSSNGVTARLGTSFEISRLLTGEISGGYQNRTYDDPRLKNLRGFVGDAAILWTPTPLTTVTLRGGADLGDTTVAGSSGTTVRRAGLEIAHSLRRNLTVTGVANISRTVYEGQELREDLASLGARIEYKLTRTFSVRASFTHEWLTSTAQGSDYTANVAQVGLRVQF